MTQPQLLLLTTDFKPNVGGIAEYLHNLWNELGDRCPATVMSAIPATNHQWSHKYTLKHFSNSSSIRHNVAPSPKESTDSPLLSLLHYHPNRELLPFINSLSQEKLYIFVGVWHPISHFWCRALRKAGIDYYLFVYGQELVIPRYQSLAASRLEDFAHAKGIYACSQATGALVQQTLALSLKIETIYPGVYEFPHQASLNQRVLDLRKQLSLQEGPVLLSLSRLVFRKGIDLVLDSLSSIIQEFPTINYLVAGEGEERSVLASKAIALGIDSHVKFLGRVDESTKQALFTLCDLFVLPTREDHGQDWEGFGITFVEAAIAGKAAIGGKTGGVVEAITHGVTGLLVNTDDAKELQSAIGDLLRNSPLREQMGIAAKTRAQQQFSWSASANKLLQTLN